jgi:hypothetical protein
LQSRNTAGCDDIREGGRQKGTLALVPAGMMVDRVDVIFTSPDKISGSSLTNADDGAATRESSFVMRGGGLVFDEPPR